MFESGVEIDGKGSLDGLKAAETSSFDVAAWKQKCYHAMNDDFNSPILIAHLFEAAKFINQVKEGSETISEDDLDLLKGTMDSFVFDVLGLLKSTNNENGTDKLTVLLMF